MPTNFAVAQGGYISNTYSADVKATCWWLRSPGGYGLVCAAYVDNIGDIRAYGASVESDNGTVRPAMWINLN